MKTKYLKARLQKMARNKQVLYAEKTTTKALLFIVFGFLPMEGFFYVIHHHLFHDVLWKIDSTRHKTQKEIWNGRPMMSSV